MLLVSRGKDVSNQSPNIDSHHFSKRENGTMELAILDKFVVHGLARERLFYGL